MPTAKTKLHRLVKDMKYKQQYLMAPTYVTQWQDTVQDIIKTLKEEKK